MGDGKALQMGTSHELGPELRPHLRHRLPRRPRATSSWRGRRRGASSTRMVGGLIMAHGDDDGLRVPPRLAPTRSSCCSCRRRGRRGAAARHRRRAARPPACGCTSTTGSTPRFGRRATDWELKGVPVRVEVGPRDLADERRDRRPSRQRREGDRRARGVRAGWSPRLDEAQAALLAQATAAARATARSTSARSRTALEAGSTGFARIPWAALGAGGRGPSWPRPPSPCAASSRRTGSVPASRGRARPRRRVRPLLLSRPATRGTLDIIACPSDVWAVNSKDPVKGVGPAHAFRLPSEVSRCRALWSRFAGSSRRSSPRDGLELDDIEHDRRGPAHHRRPRRAASTSTPSPRPPGSCRGRSTSTTRSRALHARGIEPRPRASAAHAGRTSSGRSGSASQGQDRTPRSTATAGSRGPRRRGRRRHHGRTTERSRATTRSSGPAPCSSGARLPSPASPGHARTNRRRHARDDATST